MTTLAPSRASPPTHALPMPVDPLVMTAILPERDKVVVAVFYFFGLGGNGRRIGCPNK